MLLIESYNFLKREPIYLLMDYWLFLLDTGISNSDKCLIFFGCSVRMLRSVAVRESSSVLFLGELWGKPNRNSNHQYLLVRSQSLQLWFRPRLCFWRIRSSKLATDCSSLLYYELINRLTWSQQQSCAVSTNLVASELATTHYVSNGFSAICFQIQIM